MSGGSVFVGTDDGTLYALNQQTGAVQWTTKLSAAIHSSPAVDPTHSTVIVGDDSGHVTAWPQRQGLSFGPPSPAPRSPRLQWSTTARSTSVRRTIPSTP